MKVKITHKALEYPTVEVEDDGKKMTLPIRKYQVNWDIKQGIADVSVNFWLKDGEFELQKDLHKKMIVVSK